MIERVKKGRLVQAAKFSFIHRPVFILLTQHQVAVVAEAVSFFSGHGGEDGDSVAAAGGCDGFSHHDTNGDADDYQSHS